MLVYVTEHTFGDMTDAHLRSVRAALAETTRRLSLAGKPIRFLDCSYVPEQRLLCRFAATAETQVRQALELAQLPLPAVCRLADSEMRSGRPSGRGTEPMGEAIGDGEVGS
jgi:hypothetical protein